VVYTLEDHIQLPDLIYSPPEDDGYKYVLMCRFLTGVYAQGEEDRTQPPATENGRLFDSVVDQMEDPTHVCAR